MHRQAVARGGGPFPGAPFDPARHQSPVSPTIGYPKSGGPMSLPYTEQAPPLCGVLPDDVFLGEVVSYLDLRVLYNLSRTCLRLVDYEILSRHVRQMTGAHSCPIWRAVCRNSDCLRVLSVCGTGLPLPERLGSITRMSLRMPRSDQYSRASRIRQVNSELPPIEWHSFKSLVSLEIVMKRDWTDIKADPLEFLYELDLPLLRRLRLNLDWTVDISNDIPPVQKGSFLLPSLESVSAQAPLLVEHISRLCDPTKLKFWEIVRFFQIWEPLADYRGWFELLFSRGFPYEAASESMVRCMPLSCVDQQTHELHPLHQILHRLDDCMSRSQPPSNEAKSLWFDRFEDNWALYQHCDECAIYAVTLRPELLFRPSFTKPARFSLPGSLADKELLHIMYSSGRFWKEFISRLGGDGHGAYFEAFAREGLDLCDPSCGVHQVLVTAQSENTTITFAPLLHRHGIHDWCGYYRKIRTDVYPNIESLDSCETVQTQAVAPV